MGKIYVNKIDMISKNSLDDINELLNIFSYDI